jgi:hypothetical protein
MGLSIVIAGGIAGVAMIVVFSLVLSITDQIYEVNSSRTQSVVLDNLLAHTDMEIRYLNATAHKSVASLTLVNTGIEKIWDYKKFNTLVTYNANIGGVSTLTTEHLTYNSTQAFGVNGQNSPTAQFARPNSDILNDNAWSDLVGGNNNGILYDEINEAIRNDTNFVRSGPLSLLDTTETWVVGLSNTIDPRVDSNHMVRYVYRKDLADGNQIDITVRLLQGSTVIASWSHNNINQNFQLATQTLTATQARTITDYSNLRLSFNGVHTGGGVLARSVDISWAEVEIPSPIYDCSTVTLIAGQWTMDTIYSDLQDQKILNTDEYGKICIKLKNNIYPATKVTVSITTDMGLTRSASFNT